MSTWESMPARAVSYILTDQPTLLLHRHEPQTYLFLDCDDSILSPDHFTFCSLTCGGLDTALPRYNPIYGCNALDTVYTLISILHHNSRPEVDRQVDPPIASLAGRFDIPLFLLAVRITGLRDGFTHTTVAALPGQAILHKIDYARKWTAGP